jgi:hypothetical protein
LDFWAIYNNSGSFPEIIAFEKDGMFRILDKVLFDFLSLNLEEI